MAPHPDMTTDEDSLSPMAVQALRLAKTMVKRDNDPYKNLASAGARPPNALSGPGFQALFALIGVGMTLTAIWFFFWAKNGGFKWRNGDWEDYKSTVLRRKGPDGKTLSNATKSTKLGGGSVVHGGSYFGAQSDLGYTDETGTSVDATEYRDAERGEGGLRGGDGRKEKKHRRDYTNNYKDPELRKYREEKAARVGGLNRVGDGLYTDYSGSQPSELGSNVSSNAPLVKKEKEKAKELKDPKKEAKAKEMRAKERMRKAKAAEKEAAKTAAAEAKARKEEQKAEAKRVKEEQKRSKKNNAAAPSEAPEMAEVTRPLTEYTSPQTEYTRAYTEYTAPSEAGTPTRAPTRNKAPAGPRRAPPSAAYSFTTGDDDTATVYTGVYTNDFGAAKTERSAPSEANESSYYSDYRPNADPSLFTDPNKHAPRSRSARPSQDRTSRSARPSSESRPRPSGSRPTSQSPRKQHRSSRPAPPASDIFTTTNGDAVGHMSYPCHIPGLSQAGSVDPRESVSQVGAPTNARRERGGRDVMDGYRRGGVRAVGRRDSLSDSD
ncbi:hypothetical protein BDW02DRAFT_567805 [Decorospora gaudefroyi]|uniref:Uncharacterized protein n=1 Tax=Decorospora gaudefroyi TaxID=184978 RepID=A0A6A5KJ24_9PLEO|nr:hypothetical protein BDW02DRAFT_567805 [Decorospora gaudefroyi]